MSQFFLHFFVFMLSLLLHVCVCYVSLLGCLLHSVVYLLQSLDCLVCLFMRLFACFCICFLVYRIYLLVCETNFTIKINGIGFLCLIMLKKPSASKDLDFCSSIDSEAWHWEAKGFLGPAVACILGRLLLRARIGAPCPSIVWCYWCQWWGSCRLQSEIQLLWFESMPHVIGLLLMTNANT